MEGTQSGATEMPEDEPGPFRFAGFTLDLGRGRLISAAGDVALRPKSFALLSYLVRHGGRVVTKDELLSALWPDVTVTEDSLTQCVHEVREALGPAAALLRTVPRRGYLFDAPSPADGAARGPAGTTATATAGNADATPPDPPGPVLRRDGIAILPFGLAPANPRDTFLLDGVVHDVISRLARLHSFHVIARGSTFALRHLADDPRAAGRALKVAYALGGQAQSEGERIHLRLDLVQVETGAILWTEDFAETCARFRSLLGPLIERIAQTVEMRVTAAEIRRVLDIPHEALDAWECYHAGLHDAAWLDPRRVAAALGHFRRATELAPGFARAHAAQSFCHYYNVFSGATRDRAADMEAARRTAESALQSDDANPSSHWAYGRVLWLEGDPEGCLSYSRRAVELSPGYALAHYMIGFVETHAGDARRGLGQMDRVLALSPFDPFLASIQITRALALVRLGMLDDAAVWARDAARQPNAYPMLLAPAALILAGAGRTDDARQIMSRLRTMAPDFQPAQLGRTFARMPVEVGALFRRAAPQIGL